MRQVIMFLLAFIFWLAGGLIKFTPPELALNRQRISVLFFVAGVSALWGLFHRCKCDCNGKCGCNK